MSSIILKYYIKILFSFYPALDCLSWTDFLTSSTTDALCAVRVFHRVDFHLAGFCTFSTVNALLLVYTITKNRYFIEYRIKCSQWTDIFTKRPVNKNCQNDHNHQNHIFPYVKPSDCTAHGPVQQYKRKTTFQCSCRADQFAEIRGTLSHDIYHKHRQ